MKRGTQVVGSLVLLCLLGCNRDAPNVLIAGLSSRSTLSQVVMAEEMLERRWEVKQISRSPVLVEVTAVLPGYNLLGFPGDLHLVFLNDALYRVSFVPVDFGAFLSRLADEEGVDLRAVDESQRGSVQVWAVREEGFVAWMDTLLTPQSD